jgi:hypothetical protein
MTARNDSLTCPICLEGLGPDGTTKCPDCSATYHGECWEWLGGCATYGCARMVEIKKAPDGPASFWGEVEKKCPICSETIAVEAETCPYCKTRFESARPVTRSEYLGRFQPDDPVVRECKRNAVVLLVFSVLGCTTPIALVAGILWYRTKRDLIEEAGPATKAMVQISLGVCALYIALVSFGLLVFALRG